MQTRHQQLNGPDNSGNVPAQSVRRRSFVFRIFEYFRRVALMYVSMEYHYDSPRRLWGLPLLSIDLGVDKPEGRMRHARGIIAIGTQATGVIAIGVFTARGGLAIGMLGLGFVSVSFVGAAGFAVGIFGVGIVSVSVVALGYLAIGMLAVGYFSVGIVAVGIKAVGILGIGETVKTLFP